jgi:hypothetical protein
MSALSRYYLNNFHDGMRQVSGSHTITSYIASIFALQLFMINPKFQTAVYFYSLSHFKVQTVDRVTKLRVEYQLFHFSVPYLRMYHVI